MPPLRILIVSDKQPRLAWRLAERIQNEIPAVSVCGMVYRQPRTPRRSAKDRIRDRAASVGDFLLRLAHASPARSTYSPFTAEDLAARCRTQGWALKLTDDLGCSAISDFARGVKPDLCVAWTDPPVAPALAALAPRGALGLDRSAGDDICPGTELTVSLAGHATGSKITFARAHLPVEPYDTLKSQNLKADLIAMDLLVHATAKICYRDPAHPALAAAEDALSHLRYWRRRTIPHAGVARPVLRTRPYWKLAVISLLLGPYAVLRNCYRRLRGRFPVTILFGHMVSDVPHHLGIPTDAFLREIDYLAKHYRIVTLSQAVELLRSGAVREPTVVLTFDDGYQENFLTLRAVTEATGIPAVCFISSRMAESEGEFEHDLEQGVRNFTSMNWTQIGYLSRNGVEIGSHTRTHFDCGSREIGTLREEITGAKTDIERHIGSVRFFAFPFGHPENISPEAFVLAASEYDYSLSCLGGDNFPDARQTSHHLQRKGMAHNLWELELTLQSILDLRWLLQCRAGVGEKARAVADFLHIARWSRSSPPEPAAVPAKDHESPVES